MRVGLRLGARERGRALVRRADRGDMDDAPDTGRHAGVEQRAGAFDLHRLHVVAAAVLQHADAVHDRIDVLQQRPPGIGGREPREVGFDPCRIRKAPPRFVEAAAGRDQVMAVAVKARKDRGADQAVRTGHQHAHAVLPALLTALAVQFGHCCRVRVQRMRSSTTPWPHTLILSVTLPRTRIMRPIWRGRGAMAVML